MRADGSQAEPWRNREGWARRSLFPVPRPFPLLSAAPAPSQPSISGLLHLSKREKSSSHLLQGQGTRPGTGIEMPHGRQGWGLCQDKHCPFKGCRRPSNLGKGPLLSEVQQFRADVSLNVPDPLYCKKGDNSYSCLLFLFVCLFVGWRPWPL